MNRAVYTAATLLFGATLLSCAAEEEPEPTMNFFITSVGSGDGANLGGLEGADRHCQSLAEAAGVTGVEWHAYLSTITDDGQAAVNARDRIGEGPWYNYNLVMVARDVDHLHSDSTGLSKENSLTESGAVVNGRGDDPNRHDIITGSNLDGTAFVGDEEYDNCGNWTSNAEEGATRVGHHDRAGGGQNPESWNSAHNSRGCSQSNLEGTGGAGLFYCFGT